MPTPHPVLTVLPGVCPSCREEVWPVPRRAGPCPHCGSPFVVRSRQALFLSALLSPAQARALAEYSRWVRQLRDELLPLRDALRAVASTPDQLDDTIELWYRAVVQSAPAHPWRWLERLARHRLACGRDHVAVLREARRAELQAIFATRDAALEIRVVPDQPGALCAACTALVGADRPLLVDAPTVELLPVEGCTCVTGRAPGYCGCWYSASRPRPRPTVPARNAIIEAFNVQRRRALMTLVR